MTITNISGKRKKIFMNSVNLHSLGVAETRGHEAYKKNLQEAQKFMFLQCFCKTNSEISTEVIISIYVIR